MNKQRVDSINTALKRRFRTPQDALRALGLDVELDDDDGKGALKEMMRKGEGPYGNLGDDAPEAKETAQKLLVSLRGKVDDETYRRFAALFRDLGLLDKEEGSPGAQDSRQRHGGKRFEEMFPGAERIERVAAIIPAR